MERVARFAMSGPLAAIATSLFFLLLGLLFAPFFLVSSAIIGLITLRQGYTEALKIVVSASALYCASILAFNQSRRNTPSLSNVVTIDYGDLSIKA